MGEFTKMFPSGPILINPIMKMKIFGIGTNKGGISMKFEDQLKLALKTD